MRKGSATTARFGLLECASMRLKQNVPRILLILMIFLNGCVHPIPPAPPVQPVSSEKPEAQTDEFPRDLRVKEYLINKYKPGTCYGTPGSQEETDRHLIQLREIVLIKIDQGYGFILKDGHCCSVYSYQGKIIMDGDKIIEEKITNKSIDAIPC